MDYQALIEETAVFVKTILQAESSGHDWFHIERVWRNAKIIHDKEDQGDRLVIELAALLHDLADEKLTDEAEGLSKIQYFLEGEGLSESKIEKVLEIVQTISFSKQVTKDKLSIEAKIVQDADRLDAIGAVGIARAFTYGGHSGQLIWDADKPVRKNMTKSAYRNGETTTINHFYEKLLLLKDQMNTETGFAMAKDRDAFMVSFLDQFFEEIGRDPVDYIE